MPAWSVDPLPEPPALLLLLLEPSSTGGSPVPRPGASGWGRAGGKHRSQVVQRVQRWWVPGLLVQEGCLLQPRFSSLVSSRMRF